jgi:hypothetical protein
MDDHLMGIDSINEPGQRTTMLLPASINEPPQLEVPGITSLTPDACAIGDPDFTLVIEGINFGPYSVIFFAGHDEPTTLNEDGTLSTGVKPSLWAYPVVVSCQVRNGSMYSQPFDFTFTDATARSEDDFEPTHKHRGTHTKTLHKKK